MKTYYGQMTREELNKKYFVPSSIEEMNAFIDICEKAGYHEFSRFDQLLQIGINFHGNNSITWNSVKSEHYEENGMTQINWQPEPKDLKQQLKQAMSNLEKRKAKAQKANEKLEEAKKEVDRVAAEIEKHYEDIDKVCCSVRINEAINAKAASDIPEGVDVEDPNTWRCGDIVRCVAIISSEAKRWFTVGSEYKYKNRLGIPNIEEDDEGDECEFCDRALFRFVRRP